MDFAEIFRKFEDDIPASPEVDAAEETVSKYMEQVKEKDPDLAFDLDSAIGALGRAYLKQGFTACLGLVSGGNCRSRSENPA